MTGGIPRDAAHSAAIVCPVTEPGAAQTNVLVGLGMKSLEE